MRIQYKESKALKTLLYLIRFLKPSMPGKLGPTAYMKSKIKGQIAGPAGHFHQWDPYKIDSVYSQEER